MEDPSKRKSSGVCKVVPRNLRPQVRKMTKRIKEHINFHNGEAHDWRLEDFEIGVKLGHGRFGEVFLAKERSTDFLVALKKMQKTHIAREDMQEQVIEEIEIHRKLKHPNITALYTFFYDDCFIHLVLEFASGGTVHDSLRNSPNGRFIEPEAAKYVSQTSKAVLYCHKIGVVHRDIKPENLLLDHENNVKLTDFGWALHLVEPETTVCGTPEYFSPEMVQQLPYTAAIDVWSIGVLCYELVVGKTPFFSRNKGEIENLILQCNIKFPKYLSKHVIELISSVCKYNAKDRLPLSEIVRHLWFKQNLS